MPAIFAGLAIFLAQVTGPLVSRVLGALGIGLITLTGVQAGVDRLLGMVIRNFSGAPADIASIMAMAGFDVYISLVVSAHIGIISMQTLYGAFKRYAFAAGEGG